MRGSMEIWESHTPFILQHHGLCGEERGKKKIRGSRAETLDRKNRWNFHTFFVETHATIPIQSKEHLSCNGVRCPCCAPRST